jgi:hypothetical protein
MGAVTDVVRRYVPASFKALVGATNSYDFGPSELQALANFTQFRLFSTIPGSDNEATVWNPNETELLGILTTLQFIPAAIDYWGDAIASQATSGTSEDVSFFDRRPELWRVYERLAAQAEELSALIGVSTTVVKAVVPRVSYGDNGRGILVTEDPSFWPTAYPVSNSTVDWNYGE